MSSLFKKPRPRSVLCNKDVEQITGRSSAAVCRLMKRIRAHFNKPVHAFITVRDFSGFTGIEEELVYEFLR